MGTLTTQERLQQNRGVIKIGDGTHSVDVTKNGELKVSNTAQTTTSGGQSKVWVYSDEVIQLLTECLVELKKANLHNEAVTDLQVDNTSVSV